MNLQNRIVNILTKPKRGVAYHPGGISLYKEYIIPLSATRVVCGFFGATLVGVTIPYWGTSRASLSKRPRGFSGGLHALARWDLPGCSHR
jgi:hypothetical protein